MSAVPTAHSRDGFLDVSFAYDGAYRARGSMSCAERIAFGLAEPAPPRWAPAVRTGPVCRPPATLLPSERHPARRTTSNASRRVLPTHAAHRRREPLSSPCEIPNRGVHRPRIASDVPAPVKTGAPLDFTVRDGRRTIRCITLRGRVHIGIIR